MIVREVLSKEKEEYNNVVSHVLQSYEWGAFREGTGVSVIRMGTYNGKINSGFQLTIHPFPHTHFNIGYFPRGDITEQGLEHLKKIGEEHNLVFIKIEPNFQNSNIPAYAEASAGKQNSNLINSKPILPKFTFHVDLTPNEEEVLANMKEKTRYNIKLAQKQEVVVLEKEDDKSLSIFIKFITETAKRQGFYNHPEEYYRTLWSILKPAKMCYLLIAYYNNVPLAAIMLFKFKEMLYYPYGGSSLLYREKMPNHLLHFEAIKLGKRLGCTTYDMWGAYKENPVEKDPWFGIYRFKEGFGGKLVEYPQTLDLVFNPTYYKIYRFLDPLRFKLMAIKRMLKIK